MNTPASHPSLKTEMAEFKEWFDVGLDECLTDIVAQHGNDEIWQKTKEYILKGGKRIRPFLLWKTAQANGIYTDELGKALIAFELLHNSTLIDDDRFDKHTTRRNEETLWAYLRKSNGNENGPHLNSIIANLIRGYAKRLILSIDLAEAIKYELFDTFTNINMAITRAQWKDYQWTGRLDISEEDLLGQIEGVCARFIEQMMKLGAPAEHKDTFGQIGLEIGIVFQLVDDLLDIRPKADKGREIGDDIRMGKATPLIIRTYQALESPADTARFAGCFGNADITTEDLAWVIECCCQTGAVESVNRTINEHVDNVRVEITNLPDAVQAANQWINDLCEYSVARTS